ncbi:MAG: DUF2312 domain-containing protein [Pseudomonadota bacterium]
MADGAPTVSAEGATTIAADRLRSFIERVERLEEDKAAVMEDIKQVFAEAKGEGYETKILRQVIRLRKMDRSDRQEQEALLSLYLSALGEA